MPRYEGNGKFHKLSLASFERKTKETRPGLRVWKATGADAVTVTVQSPFVRDEQGLLWYHRLGLPCSAHLLDSFFRPNAQPDIQVPGSERLFLICSLGPLSSNFISHALSGLNF